MQSPKIKLNDEKASTFSRCIPVHFPIIERLPSLVGFRYRPSSNYVHMLRAISIDALAGADFRRGPATSRRCRAHCLGLLESPRLAAGAWRWALGVEAALTAAQASLTRCRNVEICLESHLQLLACAKKIKGFRLCLPDMDLASPSVPINSKVIQGPSVNNQGHTATMLRMQRNRAGKCLGFRPKVIEEG